RRLRRNRPVSVERLARDAQLALLHAVRVRDDRAEEHVARSGHRGEPLRNHSPGARLGRCERPAARAAELEHDLLDAALLLAEQMPPEARTERLGEVAG